MDRDERISMKELKKAYGEGKNIMELSRSPEGGNSLEGIAASYELQAGSYLDLLSSPESGPLYEQYSQALGEVFARLEAQSILEAGVGEGTTLIPILRREQIKPGFVYGFDISWSRLAYGRRFGQEHGHDLKFFLGDLMRIPLGENCVDLVFTSHAIEPNRGRESDILSELFRVTNKWLVLVEPSNELGDELTRAHIEKHQFARDLHRHCLDLGFKVVEHRLFDVYKNPQNRPALIIIEKDNGRTKAPGYGDGYACPGCLQPLLTHQGNHYCPECMTIYPTILGIPCLLKEKGVIGSHYLEF